MFDDLFTRVWEHLIMRPAGPLKFRFFLQPAMAIFLAVRSGLIDSREGKPAFFWAYSWTPRTAGRCCATPGSPLGSF